MSQSARDRLSVAARAETDRSDRTLPDLDSMAMWEYFPKQKCSLVRTSFEK